MTLVASKWKICQLLCGLLKISELYMHLFLNKVYYIRKDKFSCPKELEDCNSTPGCLLSECTEFIKSLEEKFYMTLLLEARAEIVDFWFK